MCWALPGFTAGHIRFIPGEPWSFSAEVKPSTAQVQGCPWLMHSTHTENLRVSWRFLCGCVVTVNTQLAPRISAQLSDQQEPLVQLGAQTLPRWSFQVKSDDVTRKFRHEYQMWVRLIHMNMWEEELIIGILLFWITVPGHPSDGLVKLEVGNSVPAFWMTSLPHPNTGNLGNSGYRTPHKSSVTYTK